MKKILIYMLVILPAVYFAGCYYNPTRPKQIECPEPEQDCFPEVWNGLAFDTTKEGNQVTGYYYKIETVKQINSPDDEWSFSFLDNRVAALTYTDKHKQNMMLSRMVEPNRFMMESGMYIPKDGHVGNLSTSGDFAVFASNATEEIDINTATEEEIEEYYQNKADRESDEEIMYKLPYYEIMGNVDIYRAKIKGNELTDIESMGRAINYDLYTWESQPALTPDGNVVFYSSDRPGGCGGTDIWYTIKQRDGSWSKPINAGDAINTNCDELTPFVTKDGGQLLYSSAGGAVVGGYDLFEAQIADKFYRDTQSGDTNKLKGNTYFTEVENMRAPMNTEHDEIYPSSPGDPDSILYYSSNQNAEETSIVLRKGGFDMFVRHKITMAYLAEEKRREDGEVETELEAEPDLEQELEMPDTEKLPVFDVTGKVYNEFTQEPVNNADIKVREIPGRQIVDSTKTNEEGEYKIQLDKDKEFEITAQAKDLFFDSFKIRVDEEDTTKTVQKDFYLPMKFELRVNFPLDNHTDPYKYVLDSNGVETNRTWQRELDLLAENILISRDRIEKIILVGHTDYLASVSYNQTLGMNRVKFVIKELIKRGVPEDLLEGRSAGEEEPLARRPGENEKMYRKRLRRVTLEKVLETE